LNQGKWKVAIKNIRTKFYENVKRDVSLKVGDDSKANKDFLLECKAENWGNVNCFQKWGKVEPPKH